MLGDQKGETSRMESVPYIGRKGEGTAGKGGDSASKRSLKQTKEHKMNRKCPHNP